jgi:CRISPR system Cascade subunit CasD
MRSVPWQASAHERRRRRGPRVRLAATIEVPAAEATAADVYPVADVPVSFDLRTGGGRTTRYVRHTWLWIPTGQDAAPPTPVSMPAAAEHDPFELLG